jgi:prepilin-type N-terminal cleavage/methylation domain-containing protein
MQAMKKNKKKYNRHDGFTVIELIMVLVFLGIVAVIAIPYSMKGNTESNTGSISKIFKFEIR